MRVNARSLTIGLVLAGSLLAPFSARADAVEDFYARSKQITFYVGLGAGSSYDLWARLVGKYMSRYVPGHPTFVVTEMPGAGTLVMTNYLYNQAPKDGTAIGSFSAALPAQALVGLDNVRFDATKFNYIGSPESSDHACMTTKASGVTTVEEARQKEVLMGGNGPTTTNSYMPPVINKFIGTKFKVIEGYKNPPEVFLAMDRNEVGGQCAKLDSMQQQGADGLKSGRFVFLFTLNEKPSGVPGLPSVFQFIKNPEDRQTMSFLRSSIALGRPFVAPPDVPADRLAALRTAFEKTMKDPDFLAEANKAKYKITVTTGAELQTMVANLYKTPKALADKAKELLPVGTGG